MVGLEHPCARGLTPECFAKYPAWAKRAFAYRLMHTLFPGLRSRLLPRWLRDPLIGEGAEVPPGVVIPPGVVYPPWFPWDSAWLYWWYLDFEPWLDPKMAFPPGWTPEDPLPPGVEFKPSVIFPPGWKPGDPLPPGVEIDPMVLFPPGWTPGDPIPPGVEILPEVAFPPGWKPGDPLPPGVEIDPMVLFPPGWTPEDSLPPGVEIPPDAVFPPDWTPEEPLPPPPLLPPEYPEDPPDAPLVPFRMPPFVPGPPHRPYPSPVPVVITQGTFYAENDCWIKNYRTTWDETRNGLIGTGVFCDIGITTGFVQAWRGATAHQIRRYFFSVDLSAIPTGATITEVILRMTSYGSKFCGVSVQRGTQQDTITTSDYDRFAGDYFSEIDWQAGVNDFLFDQAGIDYMNAKIGNVAKVCLREYDHDYLDVQPDVNDNFLTGCYGPTTDDNADKPQFVITYAE